MAPGRLNRKRQSNSLRQASRTGQPLLMLGTAFSFVHLLDYLAEQDLWFELPPGSRALETGGYKGRSRSLPKAELHALISQRLGIPPDHIVCEYGMSELSSQAYDCGVATLSTRTAHHGSQPRPRLFRFPPWARVQVVSPETGCEVAEGETGLIRVFDLANVYSVMAIQTEDLGIRRGDGLYSGGPGGCGRAARVFADGSLVRLHGHARTTSDPHALADGRAARLHPLVSGGVDAALPADAEGFQLRQREPGHVAADGYDGGLFRAELPDRRAGGPDEPQEAARFWARPQRAGLRGAGAGAELRLGAGGRGGGRVWRQLLSSGGDGDGGAPVSGQHGQSAGIGRALAPAWASLSGRSMPAGARACSNRSWDRPPGGGR